MRSLDEETMDGIRMEQLLKGVKKNWYWLTSKVSWWSISDDDWGKYHTVTTDGSTAAMSVYKE